MTKKPPTDAELEILQVLWERGPVTVRDVHAALEHRGTGYTTVLKLMQLMVEKGLVARDESARSHVYRARVEARPTRRRLVAELLEKAFSGSASELAMNALSQRPPSPEEVKRIRAMLDELEKRGGK